MSLLDKKPIGEILYQINQMVDDSYDHQPHIPEREAIKKAKSWLVNFYRLVKDDHWFRPVVSVNEEKEVYFEWWNHHKKLIILIGDHHVRYIQAWHSDNKSKNNNGYINFLSECHYLWKWLWLPEH